MLGRRWLVVVLVVLAALPVSVVVPPAAPARAATLLVTTTADAGAGSLRGQIAAAAPGDIIDFGPAIANQTITLTSGELLVGKNLTVQNTSGGTVAVEGNANGRVFHIASGVTATIQRLTIQNGRVTGTTATDGGGGVLVEVGASLTLDQVVVQNNVVRGANGIDEASAGPPTTGGKPGTGGGVSNVGTLTVTNSTFSGNQAVGGTGGGTVGVGSGQCGAGGGGGLGGGLFTSTGTARITANTFVGNVAQGGTGGLGSVAGGGIGGAIFQQDVALGLANTTLSGNGARGGTGGSAKAGICGLGIGAAGGFGEGGGASASGGFGGVGGGGGGATGVAGFGGFGGGGGSSILGALGGVGGGKGADSDGGGGGGGGIGAGLFVNGGTSTVASSTIANGTASGGAGGTHLAFSGAFVGAPGTGLGGGIYVNGGTPALRATIVGDNAAPLGPDLNGTVASQGFNLVENPAFAVGLAPTDQTAVDPDLVPLANNGGPTQTHALRASSPAVDRGTPTGCLDALGGPLTTDQRGLPRTVDGNNDGVARCDVGAYEFGAVATPAPVTTGPAAAGGPGTADVRITKTGPANVTLGSNAVYTITVTNAGPATAEDVTVNDPVPADLTFISNSGACVTVFPCALGPLAAGQQRVITTTLNVTNGYAGPDPIRNVATVTSTTPDPNLTNNTAEARTTPQGQVNDPNNNGKGDKKDPDETSRKTDEQRLNDKHTNTAGQDQYALSGQVIAVTKAEDGSYLLVTIKTIDAEPTIVQIYCEKGACPNIQVGDILEVDGEQHGQRDGDTYFVASDGYEVTRNGKTIK
jgi:uncharacterized repeat protein (TIGR01451 family)